jgi:hypothetical protein
LAWVVLCALALWTDTWCGLVLVWLAAMTGDVIRAAAGRMNASAAIRRLNEVITSGVLRVCCEGINELTVEARFSP